MYKYILLCMIFTLLGAFGAFCFKKAASDADSIFKILLNPFLYAGGLLYIGGAVINIIVLKELKYMVVLPVTSITYIWTIIISYFALKEKITIKKIIGICLIVIGATLLGIYQ